MRAALPLLVAVACKPAEELPRLPTERLLADIQISALTDTSAEVVVRLQDQDALPGELYELDLGEELTVTLPGIVITLVSSRLNAQPVYSATIPEPPVDATYYVAFNRVPPDQTAADSQLSLPNGLSLIAPDAFSRSGEDLELSWSPTGAEDALELELNGSCLETVRQQIPDTGSYILPAGSVTGTGDCPANLTLTRLRPGTVDEAFAGGESVAFQQRSVAMFSDP